MKCLIALCVLAYCGGAWATLGFDGIENMPESTFTCLKNDGYKFFIGRVYRSNGAIDSVGLENLKRAKADGWEYVDAYMFPCHSSACGSAKTQVQKAINAIKGAGATIGEFWLDVEIYNWGKNKAENQQFILDMVSEVEALGYKPGIYSAENNWEEIVGRDWSGVSNLPLWWAAYNGDETFGKFKSFGGWSKPAIHQFTGDHRGTCNTEIDQDWYP